MEKDVFHQLGSDSDSVIGMKCNEERTGEQGLLMCSHVRLVKTAVTFL